MAKRVQPLGGATLNQRKIVILPVDSLDFDPENPRLPESIDAGDESAVIEYMLSDATIVELMGSIGAQGYFRGEPVLVVPSERQAGRYVVVEGNRRLTAVKLLKHPNLATVKRKAVREASDEAAHKPTELPAIEFGSRDEILLYLGFRHITGVKPWDSLMKARHLETLRKGMRGKNDDKTFTRLAKSIGSRSDYVKRLLTSYNIYKRIEDDDFYAISGLDETTLNFSLLTTALSYANISDWVGLEDNSDPALTGLKKKHLKELALWIFQRNDQNHTRLGESRNLKKLSAVVASPVALARFRHGDDLDTAVIYTARPTESFRVSIQQAKTRLRAAQADVHRVDPADSDVEDLQEVQSITRSLLAVLKSKLADGEEE